MVILDTSVVNVALPAMQHDLHSLLEGLQWVVNGSHSHHAFRQRDTMYSSAET
jgi:hypothetical protein